MTNWKNLRLNPPKEDCNVCVKIGLDYETFQFKRYSDVGWELIKHSRPVNQKKIPGYALYINLDEIK